MYTVSEVAKISGVTIRTLHYYQTVGLLLPARIGENGYRYYNDASLNRLQEILFYRQLDIPIKEIKMLLSSEKTRTEILQEQLVLIQRQLQKSALLEKLIQQSLLVEQEEEHDMKKEEMFKGIAKEENELSRTISSFGVIFTKVLLIFLFIMVSIILFFSAKALIYGYSNTSWITELFKTTEAQNIYALFMFTISLIIDVVLIYQFFRYKTVDLLKMVNHSK